MPNVEEFEAIFRQRSIPRSAARLKRPIVVGDQWRNREDRSVWEIHEVRTRFWGLSRLIVIRPPEGLIPSWPLSERAFRADYEPYVRPASLFEVSASIDA